MNSGHAHAQIVYDLFETSTNPARALIASSQSSNYRWELAGESHFFGGSPQAAQSMAVREGRVKGRGDKAKESRGETRPVAEVVAEVVPGGEWIWKRT